MASEASVSDQTTDGHTEGKKVTDDVKNVESDCALPSKEIGGSNDFEKQKVEEAESSETPIIEAEENIEEKNDKTPIVDVKKEGQEDKVLSSETRTNGTKENSEDKKDDLPVVEEMRKKDEDAKISGFDVSAGDGSKEVESCEQESEPSTPLEPAPAVDEIEVKSIDNFEPSNEQDTKLADTSEPSIELDTKLADISEPSNEPDTKLADISEPDTKLADISEPSNEPQTNLADISEPSNEPVTKLAYISEPSNEPVTKLADISEPSNEPETKLAGISEPSNDKPVELLDPPVIQELESEAGRETEVSESVIVKSSEQLNESSDDPTSASVSVVKPEEQITVPIAAELASKDTGEVGTVTFDASESVHNSKGKEILADEVEADPGSSTEEPTAIETVNMETETDNFDDGKNKVQENVTLEVLDAVTSDTAEGSEAKENSDGTDFDTIQKAAVDPHTDEAEEATKKEDNVSSTIEDSLKEVAVDADLSNPSSSIGMIEAISTTSAPEIAERFLKPMAKVEDKREEGFVETDGSNPSVVNKINDLGGSNFVKEVTDNISEKEKVLEDDENDLAEQKDDRLEDNMTTLAQNSRDIHVEAKTNETDTAVTEPVSKSEDAELVLKQEEPRETSMDKSVNEDTEKKDGNKNTDDQNFVESSKDGNDPKTDVEALKLEIPAKPSHKQSNSIISKVKHSLVKVKKAIIGKSPSPKAISSESKDEIK